MEPKKDFMQLSGTLVAQELEEGAPELAKYRVQLTAAGQIPRGYDWDLKVPEAVLKRDYAKFNKASSFVHMGGEHVPSFIQSMQDKVGYFTAAAWNADTKTIDANLVLARTQKAQDFKAQLDLDLASRNSMVQFSAVYSFDFKEIETKKNGNAYFIVQVEKIREVFSVDAVDRGAFPMKPLAALSEWRGNLSKEGDMAKEQETALEPDVKTDTGDKGEDIVTLQANIASLEQRNKEQAEALAERDKRFEDTFASTREAIADLQKDATRRTNEAHFNTKVGALDANDPAVLKLRESLDFGAVDAAGIDAVCDPVIAALTAAGRIGVEKETLRVEVTQDQADTRRALLTAAVLGDTYKDGEGQDARSYQPTAVEQILNEQFGDAAAAHSPQQFWDALNQAYLSHGLTDAEVDADAEGRPVARLGDNQVTTSSSWGTTLIQVITNVARILHDGSEMTGWINALIPQMHRVTVPDFNDRHYRYTGTFEQLSTVDEGDLVPDVDVSDSFRVPVKPVKKQGKFFLTYENVMNSPTAALRSLATAMGISISSTDYHEVMDLMFGARGGITSPTTINIPTSNVPAKTLGYESTSKDGTVDFITIANGNLIISGTAGDFTYTNAVNAINKMYEATAYGEDQFALAGMIRAEKLIVPPADWGAADALTRAVLEPGTANNAVNRLNGMMALPISTSSFNAANLAKFFAVVARPADAQLFVMSTLNGQPPSFQPNVLRDDNANYNRITYKASHIRRFNVVDRRALVVTYDGS